MTAGSKKDKELVTLIDFAVKETLNNPIWIKLYDDPTQEFNIEKALSTTANLPQLYRQVMPQTAVEAMNSDLPTLATVRRYQGKGEALALIMSFMDKIAALLNVKQNLSKEQYPLIAEILYDAYYYLNIAEWKFAFISGLKKGFLSRLDLSVFLDWMDDYIQQRERASSNISYSRHLATKQRGSHEAELKFIGALGAKPQK